MRFDAHGGVAHGGIGWVVLDRAGGLGAFWVRHVGDTLRRWAGDDAIAAVAIRVDDMNDASDESGDLHRETCLLGRLVKTYPKPCLFLLNGTVRGAGAGIALLGSHRVVTERGAFAMGGGVPLSGGGMYSLPRCPGRSGLYLALSGEKIGAADMLDLGLATHFVPGARLAEIEAAFARIGSAGDVAGAVGCALDAYHEEPEGEARLRDKRDVIDACFGRGSVEDILTALESDGTGWASAARASLLSHPPLALKVIFRQMQVGPRLEFDRALMVEYRVARRFPKENRDRADTLDAVSAAQVDAHFKPLEDGDLAFDGH